MGNFFKAIGKAFKWLWNNGPSLAQQISGTIKKVAPLAITIVGLVEGSDSAAEATQIAKEVQVDLSLVSDLVTQAHTGALDAAGIKHRIDVIHDHMNELLTAGHIKNPALLDKVKVIADQITAQLQTILDELPKTA
jgi:hypothetical protein